MTISNMPNNELDQSPNVRSLIKSFERSLSPVILLQRRQTTNVVRNPRLSAGDDKPMDDNQARRADDFEFRDDTPKRESISHDSEMNGIDLVKSDLALSVKEKISEDFIEQNSEIFQRSDGQEASVQDESSQGQDSAQRERDILIQQRKRVIEGLNERLSSLKKVSMDGVGNSSCTSLKQIIDTSPRLTNISTHEESFEFSVNVPVSSPPKTELDDVNVEVDNEPPFTISFDSVQKIVTPLPTRYGHIDYDFSRLIKHCHGALTGVTPEKMRENLHSSVCDDEKKDSKNRFERTKKGNRLGEWKSICRKMYLVGTSRMRMAFACIKQIVLVLFHSYKIAFQQTTHLSIDGWTAWITLFLSMIANLYPTVPRSNSANVCFCMFNYFIEVSVCMQRK